MCSDIKIPPDRCKTIYSRDPIHGIKLNTDFNGCGVDITDQSSISMKTENGYYRAFIKNNNHNQEGYVFVSESSHPISSE